jgi:hypothetical protein
MAFLKVRPTITMTTEERIEGVERFGYNRREAGFLVLAALHSRYFLRRQYCAYLGVGFGYPDDMLTSKLLRLGHAREVSLRYGRRLYRIHSKPIFAALGEVDNRNRRAHTPETTQARVMGLDYVLSRPNATWYPTETDRVSLFADQLGIGKEHLPTRRYASRNGVRPTFRYFVDKPPIFTLPGDTTVHFCFADPGYHTGDGFISFLEDYRPLLSRVERSHLIYLAADTVSFDRARSIFKRWISPSRTAPIDPVLPDLVEYFEHRREHEMAGLVGFDLQRLNRYRDARRRFGGALYDHLFGLWLANGVESIRRAISPESSPERGRRCSFSALILDQNYDLFGSFPRVVPERLRHKDAAQVSL